MVFKSDGRGWSTILCLGLVLHRYDCFSGPSKGRTEVERKNPRFKDSLISFILVQHNM